MQARVIAQAGLVLGCTTLGLISYISTSTDSSVRSPALQLRNFDPPSLPARGFPGHGEAPKAEPEAKTEFK